MRLPTIGAVTVLGLAALAGCMDPSESGNLVPKTADEDPSVPQLSLNGSAFHVETFGDPTKPVIVMLHGGPGGDYRGMLRLRNAVDGVRLEDEHFVVFWDQRGSGLSQRHDFESVTLASYDADLDAIVERFSAGRPVVLIGHSWGGMYASRYISLHPEKVAGAVLMEPGPLTGQLYEEVQGALLELDLFSEWLNDFTWAQRILGPDDHARADYLHLLGYMGDAQPRFHESRTDRMPFWRLGAVAGEAVVADGVVDGKPSWDFTRGNDRFQARVLFEASAFDTAIGEAFQRRQMAFFPNAELSVIPESGHDHPWTQPEATLRPVVRYLAEIGF